MQFYLIRFLNPIPTGITQEIIGRLIADSGQMQILLLYAMHFMQKESAKWEKVVKERNIKPE